MVGENDLGIKQGMHDMGKGMLAGFDEAREKFAQKYIQELTAGGDPEKILGGVPMSIQKIVIDHFFPDAQLLMNRISNGESSEIVLNNQLPILRALVSKLQVQREDQDEDADLQTIKPIRIDQNGQPMKEGESYEYYFIEINNIVLRYANTGEFDNAKFTNLLRQARQDLGDDILAILLKSLGVEVSRKS